jgi:hypothetical protein
MAFARNGGFVHFRWHLAFGIRWGEGTGTGARARARARPSSGITVLPLRAVRAGGETSPGVWNVESVWLNAKGGNE